MPEATPDRAVFGPFELDRDERLLLRRGEPVVVPRKALDVLAVLASRPGHLVTKDELFSAVWPGVVVEENVLSVAVSRLRNALGEEGRGYVQAVPGFGYRLVVPDAPTGDGLLRDAAAMRADPAVDEIVARISPRGDGAAPARPAPLGAPASHSPRRPAWRRLIVISAGVALAAIAIVAATRGTANDAGAPTAGAAGDVPVEALLAYREGRALWESRRGDAMLPALTQFKVAATIDSTFAPAFVGQALVYAFGYRTDAEVEAAVSRALALDSTIAEAWAARGFSRAFQQWDWRGAEEALSHAGRLDPLNVTTLQWMAALRMVQRRPAEAESYLRRAIRLAPDMATLQADLCEALYYKRERVEAREACGRAVALDPQHPFAANHLRFLDMVEPGGGAIARADLAQTRQGFDAYRRARLHAVLGHRDSSLVYVSRAVDERAVIAPFMRPDPLFDPFRDDPRWIAAMRRMGLGP